MDMKIYIELLSMPFYYHTHVHVQLQPIRGCSWVKVLQQLGRFTKDI